MAFHQHQPQIDFRHTTAHQANEYDAAIHIQYFLVFGDVVSANGVQHHVHPAPGFDGIDERTVLAIPDTAGAQPSADLEFVVVAGRGKHRIAESRCQLNHGRTKATGRCVI